MKMKTITTAALFAVTAIFFLTCNNPLSLGSRLDLEGPEVLITAPTPRKAVPYHFTIEGMVSDRSNVDRILITASLNRVDFAKQWRYTRKSGGWQISMDFGANWEEYSAATIEGSENSFAWSVPIDMIIPGVKTVDGEYLFTVQSWDSGGMSDDRSIKTLVVIYDTDPPSVEIFNPYLFPRFSGYNYETDAFEGVTPEAKELQELHSFPGDGDKWRDATLLGKFVTQKFQLQWQIEDQHDISSIDIRFYDQKAVIDGNADTPLPDGYFFQHSELLAPPETSIKPNGNITVDPAAPGFIKQKTTVQVVAICYDAAGLANKEKTIGYFIFWPEAAAPWVDFTGGMLEPGEHLEDDPKVFEENAFMIYPGRTIRATAFQAQGVSRVEFSLHPFVINNGSDNTVGDAMPLTFMRQRPGANIEYVAGSNERKVVIRNTPRPNGNFSTIFPWDFMPEARSNYYVVRAQAFDFDGTPGAVYEAVFRVQDITFPDFPVPPNPSASESLFKFIGKPEAVPSDIEYSLPAGNVPANSIRISGIAADATEIESVYIAWINPQSVNYAAMSQLSYFRDANYKGWMEAVGSGDNKNTIIEDGQFVFEDEFDKVFPNKVWKVPVEFIKEDNDTQRMWFRYNLTIDVTELLNIGAPTEDLVQTTDSKGRTFNERKNMPLSSQIFLIRAENPDGKSSITSYAPQGDTVVPIITITSVVIASDPNRPYLPGSGFTQVPQFKEPQSGNISETIIVNGTWSEDSTEYLNSETYFYDNMEFTINGVKFHKGVLANTGIEVEITPADGSLGVTSGTFKITANVGAANSNLALKTTNLRDTLVVNASVHDIGGNRSEDGASWLVESDNLRFLRISSDDDDHAYRDGGTIRIFLEFNKPVVLRKGTADYPVLLLNVTGGTQAQRAAFYDQSQTSENTRHFFEYNVTAGQNTPANQNLNVTGISIDNGANPLAANSTAWQSEDYSFTFTHRAIDGSQEEVRLTMNPNHVTSDTSRNGVKQDDLSVGRTVFTRLVPVDPATTGPDYVFTLIGGKRISVDNTPPAITGFRASPAGWHTSDVDITIIATFDQIVSLPLDSDGNTDITRIPSLTLSTGSITSKDAADVRADGNTITFRYTVGPNDTANTATGGLQVTGFDGDILDIPGNRMTSLPTGTESRTLTGVFLDTTAPIVPEVQVFQGLASAANPTPITTFGNLYFDNVFVRVTGQAGETNLGRVEYSLNGGTDWTSFTSAVTNKQLENNGTFTIQARQVDRAGNTSPVSSPVTFNLDRGSLVESITSTNANGEYTRNSSRTDVVNIQVNFRKPLVITGTPTITINVRNTTVTPNITSRTVNGTNSGGAAVSQLVFAYTVQAGDNTGTGTAATDRLNVSGFSISGTDGGAAVRSEFFFMPTAGSNKLLNEAKEIFIRNLSVTVTGTTSFTDGSLTGATAGVQADGSYNTALVVNFNRNILKNEGNITITQSATNYRIPAVLTETQRNRFRDITGFDTYYTRGTNGFINGTGPDTSTKFVLVYNFNPASPTAGAQATFSTAFRTAERITLPVGSSAVRVDGSRLIVNLAGTNALQVPGATYDIALEAGVVQDALSNRSPVYSTTASIGGVARPFIRVLKKQDTIANQTASATAPRLVATQPLFTTARMDTRTPGANIHYIVSFLEGSVTNAPAFPGNFGTGGPSDNNNDPTRPGDPRTTTANRQQYTAEVTIGGDTTTITNVQGLRWHVRAKATSLTGNAPAQTETAWSGDSEEMAYRTVLTYAVTSTMSNAAPGQNFTSGAGEPNSGKQVWIRGGDALEVSTVPGFPLTWEDNWDTLKSEGRRAGIRLLSLVSVGGNLNTSTWRWVTWEVNVDTYFDIILGYDPNSTEGTNGNNVNNIVTQYGPRQWALQRAGWTSYKQQTRIFAGKHRYLVVTENGNFEQKGQVNFSGTFSARPAMTGTGDVTWTP